jgi:hypothetical protein
MNSEQVRVADPDAIAGNSEIVSQLSAFDTTVAYVVQFYPLWFTYYQSQLGNRARNSLVGPDRVSPVYHYVVAINVDTLYVSSYLDLTAQPVILTIPSTPPFPSTSYSILMLDPYGDLLPASANIPKTPGRYALIHWEFPRLCRGGSRSLTFPGVVSGHPSMKLQPVSRQSTRTMEFHQWTSSRA